MKIPSFFKSLRFRLTAGMLLILILALSALAYIRHVNYQQQLLANMHAYTSDTGEIIENSLQYAMMANDFTILQQIVDDIGAHADVAEILLLDKAGKVLVASDETLIGTVFPIQDETCQACHRFPGASRNESVILPAGEGEVLRNVNAIENQPSCQSCHDPNTEILGVLISDLDMAPVEQALAVDRRNSLLWSASSIVVVVLITDLLLDRVVISRLEQLLAAIKRVAAGDLDAKALMGGSDEIGDLADSFNQMTVGLREKRRLEDHLKEQTGQLQAQAARLETLNTMANTVSHSLHLQEVLNGALAKVLELIKLRAGWIVLRDDEGAECELVAWQGLPREVALAHVECAWNRCICAEVLQQGQPRLFDTQSEHACPTAAYFGMAFRACVPLWSQDRVLGVMSLVGETAEESALLTAEAVETLTAIGRQIGIAVENAQLYERLRQQESLRRHLLERIIRVQEQERKRIALELHDQTGQSLTFLMMTLRILAESDSLPEVKARLQELRDLSAQILQQVHDLALELRPSILDDLGLLAALRHLHKGFEDRFHVAVDFQTLGLDGERLRPDVETALYRIVQEALTNVARHAGASNVSVLIERQRAQVMLIVEDDGRGFEVSQAMGDPSAGRLGLYSMRERAAFLGGTLTIESSPATGTAVYVQIPLETEKDPDGQDQLVGGG